MMGKPYWGTRSAKIEEYLVESGPRIDAVVMPERDILARLRHYRAHKSVPLAGLARYCQVSPHFLYRAIRNNKLPVGMQRALSWQIIALDRGEMRFVRWTRPGDRKGGAFHLVRGDAPLTNRALIRAAERCVCGRYERCPCGCVPVEKVVKR